MANYVSITSDKKKWIAFVLCLCTGFLGGHYYYVGRTIKGLLYTFTGGLFFIGWLWDIFVILSGKFKDNTGAYLRQ